MDGWLDKKKTLLRETHNRTGSRTIESPLNKMTLHVPLLLKVYDHCFRKNENSTDETFLNLEWTYRLGTDLA